MKVREDHSSKTAVTPIRKSCPSKRTAREESVLRLEIVWLSKVVPLYRFGRMSCTVVDEASMVCRSAEAETEIP